jgi:hypothetical protein
MTSTLCPFVDVILMMADAFISPAAATKAQQSFDRISYSRERGIRSYMMKLQQISYHIMLTIDEYTLRKRIVDSIPASMRYHLIDYKGLSTTTSTVMEWMEAIEVRELEIRERAAYDDATTPSNQRKPTSGVSHARAPSSRPQPATTKVATQPKPAPHARDRVRPTGPTMPSKRTVPLSDITCHACGKKGHFKGSRECPNTVKALPSARLHAMGFDQSTGEINTPEVLTSTIDSTAQDEEAADSEASESPFEGSEYDGDADMDLAPRSDEEEPFGSGAIVASLHAVDEEDDDVVYMAVMATSDQQKETRDTTVANDLLKSVKAQYEERGSGIKPRPRGPSAKQLQADSQKEWASTPTIRNKDRDAKTLGRGRCLTSLLNINGVDAFLCWDSGSELDAISPDFVRATDIKYRKKETPVKIRLGTKGTSSTSSYEADVTLGFKPKPLPHTVDLVNLDRWDMILGATFFHKYGVVLDFKNRTITFGNTTIQALSKDEEATVRKSSQLKERHPDVKTTRDTRTSSTTAEANLAVLSQTS